MITDKFNKLKLTATAKTPISSAGTNKKNCTAIPGKDGLSKSGEVKGEKVTVAVLGVPRERFQHWLRSVTFCLFPGACPMGGI